MSSQVRNGMSEEASSLIELANSTFTIGLQIKD